MAAVQKVNELGQYEPQMMVTIEKWLSHFNRYCYSNPNNTIVMGKSAP